MPERPTSANAGFVWQSLNVNDAKQRSLPDANEIHVTRSGILKYKNQTGLSQMQLNQAIQYYEDKNDWHTLTANDGLKEGAIELKPENGLAAQIRWATLKANGNHQRNSQDKHVSLGVQVGDKPGDKLNPDWCEQLMGFPVGWTDSDAAVPVMNAQGFMCHDWPAPPGIMQYPHEVPRTTGRKAYRKDRIKALGNGVVAQDVIPIALAIRYYLDNKN